MGGFKIYQNQIIPISAGALEIFPAWCKGCRLCADACPKGLLTLNELGKVQMDRAGECPGCGQCEAICPDFAIRVKKNA